MERNSFVLISKQIVSLEQSIDFIALTKLVTAPEHDEILANE